MVLDESGPQGSTDNQWAQLSALCWLTSVPRLGHFGGYCQYSS